MRAARVRRGGRIGAAALPRAVREGRHAVLGPARGAADTSGESPSLRRPGPVPRTGSAGEVPRGGGPGAAVLVLVGVLGLAARLLPVLLGPGLASIGRYDDGVYYTAADALTFGRVPYR